MNTQKYTRLSVVVHCETANGLRDIADAMGQSVSQVVRHLVAGPVSALSDDIRATPKSRRLDELVDEEYQLLLDIRDKCHG